MSKTEPERFAHQDMSNEELLETACQKKDWQSILPLSSLLLSGNKTVVLCADAAIKSRVSHLSSLDYLRLDEAMRETLDYRHGMGIDKVTELVDVPVSGASLGVISCAGKGYIRQAAVENLAKIHDGSEIPFLLIRLTDWVIQVAQRASASINERLTPENAHHFVPHLALLHLLSQRRRARTFLISQTIFDKITKLMTSLQAVPALLHELSTNPETATRRGCLKYLLSIDGIDVKDAIIRTLDNPDAQLRRIAINCSSAKLSASQAIPILKRACRDNSPGVRGDSLRALAEITPAEAVALVHELLLDRSATVRGLARYYAKKLTPETDIIAFYQNCFTEQKALPIAIAAIGEVGSSKDATLVAPFLNSDGPRYRKAAIKSVANLDGSKYSEDLLAALASPEPGVSRVAAIALVRYMHILDTEQIWQIFEASDLHQIKLNCLRLLNRTEKWRRITYLLQALVIDSEEIQSRVLTNIHNWVATYRTTWQYTMPTSEQAARFTAALQKAAPQLPPTLREILATCAAEMSKT